MQMLSLPADSLAFALAAAAAFAGLDLVQKWSSRHARVPTPASFLALRLLAGALVSPLLLLLAPWAASAHPPLPIGPLLGLILTNLLGNALYIISVYRADISVLGSLWPLKSAYLPLLVFLLPPHLVFPLPAYALILLAVVGAMLVAWNGKLRLRGLRERPIALMVLATIPIFALSDYFMQAATRVLGSALTTIWLSVSLALLYVPLALLHQGTRRHVLRGLVGNPRGLLGALLTGLLLVGGVALIGEAFRRGGAGGLVTVNLFAMLSGVLLLLVNALRPGWLEQGTGRIYALRFVGATLLIAAAARIDALRFALSSGR